LLNALVKITDWFRNRVAYSLLGENMFCDRTKEVQPLSALLKVVTEVLYLNRSAGILPVSPVQFRKQLLKLVAEVLYLNKSAGMLVSPVQTFRQSLKLVAEVLYLNKSAGILVSPAQPPKQPWKLESPGIKGNAETDFNLFLFCELLLLPNRRLPPLSKLPDSLAL
jgi:hypothetical protein